MKEENKLIAEFMGIPKCDRCEKDCDHYKFGSGNYSLPKNMGYHHQWEWLMPVVEKICDYEFPPDREFIDDIDRGYLRTFGMKDADTGFYMVRFNRGSVFIAETLIGATYVAVVDFITYLNSTKL